MRPPVAQLQLSDEDRAILEQVAKLQSALHRDVHRAQALLMAGDGLANLAIGAAVGVSPTTVASWRARFQAEGWTKLGQMRRGRGRKPSIPAEKVDAIVHDTLHTKPEGETHWTSRTMAKRHGVSHDTAQRIWVAPGPEAAPGEDLQALQRQALRGEAGRCGRCLPEPAQAGGRSLCGREEPDSGPGPDPARPSSQAGSGGDHDP